MTAVRRDIVLDASPADAEALWYDVSRWAAWVDGFGHTVSVRDPWPDAGGIVVWQSNPYGRGRVIERVQARRAGQGQTSAVDDDRTTATQSVSFAQVPGGVRVALALDYTIKNARLGTFVVDWLFVRRAVGDALRRTLEAFGRELG